MRFFTQSEAVDWCRGKEVRLDERERPVWPRNEEHHVTLPLPATHARLTWFCRHLEASLQPWESCLLWVTEWGVWDSSENWHLYYRLRQSYGDHRLLHEAPAHLFLNYEGPDLMSFLEVGIICGWDIHLIPFVGYARAFVSHDEFVEFTSDNSSLVEEFRRPLVDDPKQSNAGLPQPR